MKRLIRTLEVLTFVAVFAVFCLLAYQSMSGQQLPQALGLAVLVMDVSFVTVTVLRLFVLRPRGAAPVCDGVSVLLIIAALAMMALDMPYSPLSLLFWDGYLLLLFGWRTADAIIGSRQK